MEELLIALLERISNKIPEISLIDEDCGQLEALEDETRICTRLHSLVYW